MPDGWAQQLWQRNQDLARANLGCRFVRGLDDGTLPRPAFQAYLAQDAYFLEAFARAYALALARSPDRETLHTLATLLAGVRQELELHHGYAARWQVDLGRVTPHPSTLAYTDFLLATSATGSVGDILVALTPCLRLYAFLGQSLRREFPAASHAYAEWIMTYSDPGFEALAAQLEQLVDRHTHPGEASANLYRRALGLELGFFNAYA